MTKRTPHQVQVSMVWRISEDAPMGRWVSPTAVSTRPSHAELPEVSTGNWVTSSYDLLDGIEVNECDDNDTKELFDSLFGPGRGTMGPVDK
jgi:hypothetical protein